MAIGIEKARHISTLGSTSGAGVLSVYVIITVPADGLAPDGAKPSTDSVMIVKVGYGTFEVLLAIDDWEHIFTDLMTIFEIVK